VDLPRRASPFCANCKDQQEFDQLLDDLRAYHRPADVHQRLLIDQLAKSQWLLARAQRLQAVAYDLLAGLEDENDPDLAIVKSMRASNPDVIGRLERYAASAHRPRGAAHTEAATRRTWPRPASPLCASWWRAERSFYKALRELTKQNEAKLVAAVEKKMIDQIVYGPPPNHPRPENRPAPIQNEPTTSERALRL
jgi:hypothetical protein